MTQQTAPFDATQITNIGDEGFLSLASGPSAWAVLHPISGSYQQIKLYEDSHTFGRHHSNITVFSENGVSGKHAMIVREKNSKGKTTHIYLEDTSTNGTYINGNKVNKSRFLLNSGDQIMFLPAITNGPSITFLLTVFDEKQQGGPFEKYQLGNKLGSGQFAEVHLCIERETGTSWAIKIIDKKKHALSSATDRPNALLDEVAILRAIQHPHCIGIHDVFETDETLYLILELVTGGELFDKIVSAKRFPEDLAKKYFIQMLEAILYLHSRGIVHRDLKPENILVKSNTDDSIKLSDFGLSRVTGDTSKLKTMCGTPQYVAPEVLTQGGANNLGYDKACDLWSLGVILYVMIAGYAPFYEENRPIQLFDQIKTAYFDFPQVPWKSCSHEVLDLIVRLLIVDPNVRLTAEQALQHPWITGKKLSDVHVSNMLNAIVAKHKKTRKSIWPYEIPSDDSMDVSASSTSPNDLDDVSNGKENHQEEQETSQKKSTKKTAASKKTPAAAPKKVSAKTASAKKVGASKKAAAVVEEPPIINDEEDSRSKRPKRKATSAPEDASPPKRSKKV